MLNELNAFLKIFLFIISTFVYISLFGRALAIE